MKILQLTPSFYPAFIYGGPSRSVYQLSCALGRHGAQVRVLTTNANGAHNLSAQRDTDIALADSVSVRYCRRVALNSVSPRLLWELGPAFAWADIIHLQGVYSFPTLFALARAAQHHTPLVWSPRGAFGPWRGSRRPQLKRIWRALCRRIAPPNLTLHATSDDERDHIAARWPGARIRVVPNGVRLPTRPLTIPPPRTASETLQLLFLGRLAPIKGIEQLLRACAHLDAAQRDASEVPHWQLTIAGAGDPDYRQRLHHLSAQLGIAERTTFVGLVSGDRRRACFEEAHVTVVPSHREAFSMVVAESLAHRTPVIASHHTPWRSLPERGCGLWVDNTPSSLAHAITTIGKMPLGEMGARGQAWMEERFDWGRIAREMVGVYAEAMKL